MKLKAMLVALIGLAVIGTGILGYSRIDSELVAAKKSKKRTEQIERDKKMKIKTKFAYTAIGSVEANQMLLLKPKVKIVIN